MRTKGGAQRDLFGTPVRQGKSRNQVLLEKYDRETLPARLERLKWVDRVFPRNSMFLMPPESSVVFNEAKMAFINGEPIAALLLAAAFIEHRLGGCLEGKGYRKEAKAGLRAIIQCARDNVILPEFLLAKADHIQDIRNPFVHLKPAAHPHRISHRSFMRGLDMTEVMESDAREALSTMYTIAIARELNVSP